MFQKRENTNYTQVSVGSTVPLFMSDSFIQKWVTNWEVGFRHRIYLDGKTSKPFLFKLFYLLFNRMCDCEHPTKKRNQCRMTFLIVNHMKYVAPPGAQTYVLISTLWSKTPQFRRNIGLCETVSVCSYMGIVKHAWKVIQQQRLVVRRGFVRALLFFRFATVLLL